MALSRPIRQTAGVRAIVREIDKSARFAYPRALRQVAAPPFTGARRPFLSIPLTDSILRNER
jgi:hypothetical protein